MIDNRLLTILLSLLIVVVAGCQQFASATENVSPPADNSTGSSKQYTASGTEAGKLPAAAFYMGPTPAISRNPSENRVDFDVLPGINVCAGWGPDVRLTENPNTYPARVAIRGNYVHLVWQDFSKDSWGIYYKRSTDGGESWGADTRLTNKGVNCAYPAIAVSGSTVWVMWQTLGFSAPLYYKWSIDNGQTWGEDIALTDGGGSAYNPSIAVWGDVIHIVWEDHRDNDFAKVYYRRSTDGGRTWREDIKLSDQRGSQEPLVAVAGDNVHVIWKGTDKDDQVLYYMHSTNGGGTWGEDVKLGSSIWPPCIATFGNNVILVWEDSTPRGSEVYYRRSADGGQSWSEAVVLSDGPAEAAYPNVVVWENRVYAFWQDNRDTSDRQYLYWEIYFKSSDDWGKSWSGDKRITQQKADAIWPQAAVDGNTLGLVWQDSRDGKWQIYYKRYLQTMLPQP